MQHRLTSAKSTKKDMLSELASQSIIYEYINVSYITFENVINYEKYKHTIDIYSVYHIDLQLYKLNVKNTHF